MKKSVYFNDEHYKEIKKEIERLQSTEKNGSIHSISSYLRGLYIADLKKKGVVIDVK